MIKKLLIISCILMIMLTGCNQASSNSTKMEKVTKTKKIQIDASKIDDKQNWCKFGTNQIVIHGDKAYYAYKTNNYGDNKTYFYQLIGDEAIEQIIYNNYEPQLWSYNDKLYGVEHKDARKILVEFSDDLTETVELFDVGVDGNTYEETHNTGIVWSDDGIYVYDIPEYLKNSIDGASIRRYSLDGKNCEVIATVNDGNGIFDSVTFCGGKLFFIYYTKTYISDFNEHHIIYNSPMMYCYDPLTKEISKVFDLEIIDYYIDVSNGVVYYYTPNAGLYEYNISTELSKQLYVAASGDKSPIDEKTGWCKIYADDKYIYVDSELSAANWDYQYYSRYKEGNPHIVKIMHRDGTPIRDITHINDGRIYIGRDDKIYEIWRGYTYSYLKKDIEEKNMIRTAYTRKDNR